MKKIFNQKNILNEAVVLLIATIMILSTVVVTANTETNNKVEGNFEPALIKTTKVSNNPLISKGTFFDDFEGYDDFVLDFPPWTQFDGDGAATYGFTDIDFLNEYYTGSFIIFNPSQTVPPYTEDTAHSGEKYAACFNAVLPASNDDWLITPQLTIESSGNVTFWAKEGSNEYQPEEFRVAISTTDTDPDSFSYITSYINPSITWEEYSYSLDSYIGEDIYIGIHVTSYDAFWFGVDDFTVTGVAIDPPDLDCEGSLSWTEVIPGDTVIGDFEVSNIGGAGSTLNWEIESYPEWGEWTFNPESGSTTSIVNVDVEVIAPNEEETDFSGEIVIVNTEDPEDTCVIDVALATPYAYHSYRQIPMISHVTNMQSSGTLSRDVLLDEGFEDGIMPPTGWYTDELNLVTPWTIVDAVTYPDFVHTGDYAGWINYDTPNPSDNWLVSPDLDLTGYDSVSLVFWAESDTNWPTATMELHIRGDGFDDLLWDMIADETWADFIYREMTFDLSDYIDQTINISWRYVGQDGNSFGLDDITVTTGGEPAVPDLDCYGTLDFTDVTPGDTVSGTVTVENIGEEGSLLDWEVESFPDWGEWTFDPEFGEDLGDGETATVSVDIVAPGEEDTEYTGEVVFVNSEDPDDTCVVEVTLKTPVSQSLTFLELLAQRFPIVAKILEMLF